MKGLVVIVAVAVLGLLGWMLVRQQQSSEVPPVALSPVDPDPPTAVNVEGDEVFRRAFWRHPSDGDRIFNAERREWSDETGVKRWQWFLEVEPSEELVKHLRGGEAFPLVPNETPEAIAFAPEWFAPSGDGMEVLESPGGGMRLIFTESGKRLYATDAGGGFTEGAKVPVRTTQMGSIENPGRLPATSPPNPIDQ